MKVYYLPIRSSFEESFKEKRCFYSVEKLIDYIIQKSKCLYSVSAFSIDDIYIRYYGYDKRINSFSFLICVGRYLDENYIKKYGRPQAHGYLYFPLSMSETITTYNKLTKEKTISCKTFIKYFDNLLR